MSGSWMFKPDAITVLITVFALTMGVFKMMCRSRATCHPRARVIVVGVFLSLEQSHALLVRGFGTVRRYKQPCRTPI